MQMLGSKAALFLFTNWGGERCLNRQSSGFTSPYAHSMKSDSDSDASSYNPWKDLDGRAPPPKNVAPEYPDPQDPNYINIDIDPVNP